MTDERWEQVEKLYHAAFELEPNERAAFLKEACAGDTELQREVESLLGQAADSFLSRPVAAAEIVGIVQGSLGSLIGRQLGNYQVEAKIGEGGMGEVYRAKDTKLGREVALKVLPPEFAQDGERLARFRREARLLASLNHPNIATIHGLEESGETHFLVMELVEGQTLSERVAAGAIPPEESLKIGQQIAEALEQAHQHKVVHRDLKPANLKLTSTGRVKVLDFGLAKALAEDGEDSAGTPTLSALPTEMGRVMGTPAYMSPEQAQGNPVDSRTDIWAFGCVLYELLATKRAFPGENVQQTIAAVLRSDPDWESLPPAMPDQVRELLKRCLQKDPAQRIQSALDLSNELLALKNEMPAQKRAVTLHKKLSWATWLAGAAAVLVTGLLAWTFSDRTDENNPSPRSVRALTSFQGWEWSPSWSPDGSMVAYAQAVGGDADIAILSVGGSTPHILTEQSPADEINPRWSPDGSKIAYISDRGSGTDVYWISATGGPEQKFAETGIPFLERMGAWAWSFGGNPWSPDSQQFLFPKVNEDGDIALWRIHLSTGAQEQITFPPPGAEDIGATWSFDGKAIVFVRNEQGASSLLKMAAEGGEPKVFLSGQTASSPSWFPDNQHLAISSLQGGARNIWEVDVASGAMRQLTVGAGVDMSPNVSRNGSIAYVQTIHETDLYWIDLNHPEEGEERLTTFTGDNFGARVSPDGRRIVYFRGPPHRLWIYDRSTKQHRQLTMPPGNDRLPDWSPDGNEIVFLSDRDGAVRLWVVSSETGVLRRLSGHELPWSNHTAEGQLGPRWSPDGQVIGYRGPADDGGDAVWLIDSTGENRRMSSLRGVLSFGGWYRDSQRVLYTREAPDGSGLVELRAANLRTKEDALLFSGPIAEVSISPDGDAVMFIDAVSHFTMQLYLLRLAAPDRDSPEGLPTAVGNMVQITFGEGRWHVHSGGWAPDGRGIVYSRDTDQGDIFIINK